MLQTHMQDRRDKHHGLYKIDFSSCEDGVIVNLSLKPYESLFIIFGPQKELLDIINHKPNPEELSHEYLIDGEWECYIAEPEEYPNFKSISVIKGLGDISLPSILPRFSGTILYKIEFNLDAIIEKGQSVILDLGEVYEIAQVRLNNYEIGTKICPPYIFDITGCIIHGKNILEVEVTNTLAKKIHDKFSRFMPQEPSGLIGPVRILY